MLQTSASYIRCIHFLPARGIGRDRVQELFCLYESEFRTPGSGPGFLQDRKGSPGPEGCAGRPAAGSRDKGDGPQKGCLRTHLFLKRNS